jgi:hypothetical protein
MVITIASLKLLDNRVYEQGRRKENRGGRLHALWKYEGQRSLGLFRLGIWKLKVFMEVLERGICPLCTGTEYELHMFLICAEN